jgi:5-methylcytosine-specific restriction endonuclease McrA
MKKKPSRRDRLIANQLAHHALAEQGGVCHWCRRSLTADEVTADHLIPRHAGGKTTHTNIVAACGPCNSSRCSVPGSNDGRLVITIGETSLSSPFAMLSTWGKQ